MMEPAVLTTRLIDGSLKDWQTGNYLRTTDDPHDGSR
jgi:hypothetical protein